MKHLILKKIYAFSIIFIFLSLSGCDFNKKKMFNNIKLVVSLMSSSKNSDLYLIKKNKLLKIQDINTKNGITPKFSNDGNYIAYSAIYKNNYQIFIYDIKLNLSKQITHNSKEHLMPSWSNDDKKITYIEIDKKNINFGNSANIGVYNFLSEKTLIIDNNGLMDVYPVFLGNDQIIYESGDKNSFFGIFAFDLNSKINHKLVYDPMNSANGIPDVYKDFILFERAVDKKKLNYGNFLIQYKNLENHVDLGGITTKGNTIPRISPNGKLICYQYRDSEYKNFKVRVDKLNLRDSSIKKQKLTVFFDENMSFNTPLFSKNSEIILTNDFHNIYLGTLDGKLNKVNTRNLKYRGLNFLELWNYDIY